MRMTSIKIQLPQDLLEQVDEARGLVSRAAWIRALVEAGQVSVAPTGSEQPAPTRQGRGSNPRGDARKGSPAVRVQERDFAPLLPKNPSLPVEEHPLTVKRIVGRKLVEETVSHCNRGVCTGVIKPNGHCLICNQRPLKESKRG